MNQENSRVSQLIKWLVVIVSVGIILFGLWKLASNGRLVVEGLNTTGTTDVTVVDQNSGLTVAKATLKGDASYTKRLPSGPYEVRVVSGNKASAYFVTVPRFLQGKKVSNQFANQADRQKIARGAALCSAYTGTSLYSFTCSGASTLNLHSPTTPAGYSSQTPLTIGKIIDAQSYLGNLLVLREVEASDEDAVSPSLVLINGSGIIKSIALPADFASKDSDYHLLIDRKDGNRFAITKDKYTRVLLYDNLNAQPRSMNPTQGLTIDSYAARSLDIYDSHLLFVAGQADSAPDSDNEAEKAKDAPATQVVLFDISNPTVTSKKLTTKQRVGSVSLCDTDTACFFGNSQLTVMQIKDKGLSKTLAVSGVTDASRIGGAAGIAYVQDDMVYKLDLSSQTATALYTSHNFKPSSITYADKGLLMSAFLNGTQTKGITHSFVLQTSPAASNQFMDDDLPYQNLALGFVADSDYAGNTILNDIFIDNSFGPDTTHPTFVYDTNEFNTKKAKLLADLASKGYTTAKYNIVVRPFQ